MAQARPNLHERLQFWWTVPWERLNRFESGKSCVQNSLYDDDAQKIGLLDARRKERLKKVDENK